MPFWAYFDTLCLAGPSLVFFTLWCCDEIVQQHYHLIQNLCQHISPLKNRASTKAWMTLHVLLLRFLLPWSLIINSDLQKRNYIGHLQFTKQRLEQKRSDISFKELGISSLHSVNHVDRSHSVLVRFLVKWNVMQQNISHHCSFEIWQNIV